MAWKYVILRDLKSLFGILKDKNLDFILGSVHFIDDFAFDYKEEHWNGVYVDKMYQRYFETSLDLINCGIYKEIAHPDCIKVFGHTPSFSLDEYYEKLAQALSENNMYAEQNNVIL